MTVDVLLLDECAQLSAQQLSIIDVILRDIRQCQIPFGGCLLLGSFE